MLTTFIQLEPTGCNTRGFVFGFLVKTSSKFMKINVDCPMMTNYSPNVPMTTHIPNLG